MFVQMKGETHPSAMGDDLQNSESALMTFY